MNSLRSRATLALTGVLALAACAGEPLGPGPGPDDASATIRVSANVANTPIDLLVVTVSAADIAVPAVFNLPVVSGTASGTLHIPPGAERVFAVEAFDAGGEVTHDGSAIRDVQRGQNAPLSIPLTPRSGQVPITISFGDFSVEVSPAAQLLDLSASTTTQLTVTVVNGSGATVTSPQVIWATTNPARATVSASGLVTGLLPGEVDIVATYNGIAGISHLTLSGAAPDTYYADSDLDTFGDPAQSIAVPTGFPAPDGYVTDSGDCNDTDAATFPG
ncbi:MAG TPA: Ig-like domain-containing protein, partial [Gemmatimonadales bacterium]|nr:Ig-like domain-containing protein [Gemmatimonadales bacterium]